MKKVIAQAASVAFLVATVQHASADDQVAYGEYLSGECVTCHQTSGEDKGIPSIVGWDPEAFVAVMNSDRSKERENKVMITIASALAHDEIAALAAYFKSIGPAE